MNFLQRIYYGGNLNNNTLHYNTVEFDYIERNDPTSIYIAGNEFKSKYLLQQISFSVNWTCKGCPPLNTYKEYKLKYGFNKTAHYLNEIQEIDSNNIALNSTIFKYGNNPQRLKILNQPEFHNMKADFIPVDVNGDGYSDIVACNAYYNNDNNKWSYTDLSVYTKNPDTLISTYTKIATLPFPTPNYNISDGNFNKTSNSTSVGDFDGNGTNDMLFANTEIRNTKNHLDKLYLFKSPNQGTYPQAITITPPLGYTRIHPLYGNYIKTGDFNGDGRTDILVMLGDANQDYTSQILFDGSLTWTNVTAPSAGYWANCDEIHVIDFNGDGKQDIMAISNNRYMDV